MLKTRKMRGIERFEQNKIVINLKHFQEIKDASECFQFMQFQENSGFKAWLYQEMVNFDILHKDQLMPLFCEKIRSNY